MNSWLLPLRRRMLWQSCSLRRALLPGRSLRRSCQRKERSMTRCFKKVASSLFAVARKASRLGSFFGRNTPILEVDIVATKTLLFVLLFLPAQRQTGRRRLSYREKEARVSLSSRKACRATFQIQGRDAAEGTARKA